MTPPADVDCAGSSSSGAESIHARMARLNHLILGQPAATSKCSRTVGEALSREGLLDAVLLLYDECNKELLKKRDRNIFDFVNKYRDVVREANALRVSCRDFDFRSLIGTGHFGDVHLAAERSTGDLFAIKKIRKAQAQTAAAVREERDIMAHRTSEWITGLHYAFQDHEHLYLCMEYLPGGDLLGLMCRHGAFDEDTARFYLAEITQALHALHQQGFAHRDVKPENILVDRFGHLKLGDFGTAAQLSRGGTAAAGSWTPVGTADYIAPELLDALQTTSATSAAAGGTGAASTTRPVHDATCDFWSMGIIGYEFLTEQTPFNAADVTDTYALITKHVAATGGSASPATLTYPIDVEPTRAFRSLIDALVTRRTKRLTYAQILRHEFFAGVEWELLRMQVPPMIPALSGEDDTSNFDDVNKLAQARRSTFTKAAGAGGRTATAARAPGNDFSGQNMPFLGYSYVHDDGEDSALGSSVGSPQRPIKTEALASGREAALKRECSDLQKRSAEQQTEIDRLNAQLLAVDRQSRTNATANKLLHSADAEVRRLKEELRKRLIDLAALNTDCRTLRSSLNIVEEARAKRDANIADVVSSTYKKWEKIKSGSDRNYEAQLNAKQAELAALGERVLAGEADLSARANECAALEERVRTYKQQLHTAKAALAAERLASEQSKQEAQLAFDQRVRDLKQRAQREESAKQAALAELQLARSELSESSSSAQSVEYARKAADKNSSEMRQRLSRQIAENHAVREEAADATRRIATLEKQLEAQLKELTRLRQDNELLLAKDKEQAAAAAAAATSRRSSTGTEMFRSAHGSIESLAGSVVVEEQLRSDLSAAKQMESEQRRRAERLEESVARLEVMVDRLQPAKVAPAAAAAAPVQDTLLEKQNSRLEDQLASVREQAIVERQASRTAHLSLYKLERQLEETTEDRKRLQRRIELADERHAKVRAEHAALERQLRDAAATVASQQQRIDELLAQCADYRQDVSKEHAMWEKSEAERMRDKSEIIEHVSRVHTLEERGAELRRKLAAAEQRCEAAAAELQRVRGDRDAAAAARLASEELHAGAEADLLQVRGNYDLLKHAATILEQQLNELEAMHEREQRAAREARQHGDLLRAQLAARDADLTALRDAVAAETALKQALDRRCTELQALLHAEKEQAGRVHCDLIDTQEQLLAQTRALFAAQEAADVQAAELAHVQRHGEQLDAELAELKEENSRMLTDLYAAKEEATRFAQSTRANGADAAAVRNQLEQVRGTLAEQLAHQARREHKAETTRAQLQKLVEFLQHKVASLEQKKKPSLATKLFGGSSNAGSSAASSARKENIAPGHAGDHHETALAKKLQEDLRRERQRNAQLKEQLIQAKTDIQTAAAEAAKAASCAALTPLSSATTTATTTTRSTAEMGASQSTTAVAAPSAPSVTEFSHVHIPPSEALTLNLNAGGANGGGGPEQEHRFEMTLDSADTAAGSTDMPPVACCACAQPIDAGRSYMRCRGSCKSAVHRRCRDAVRTTCEEEERVRMRMVEVQRGVGVDVRSHEREETVACALADTAPNTEQRLDGGDGGGGTTTAAEEYDGDVVLRSAELSPPVAINCVYEVKEGVLLLGAESGLYSYHCATRQLVHIPPVPSVQHIAACVPLSKCLLIGDAGRQLYVCELRHLHSRAEATACLRPQLDVRTIELPFAQRHATERWLHLSIHVPAASASAAGRVGDAPPPADAHVIASTGQRLVILRYDVAQSRFNPVCALDTARPVSCVLYTTYATAIVAADKFFEIDLRTFQAEEFLDESDASCAEARLCGRPVAAFRVNGQEFLLCFAEFGVFVDTYGDRSRPENVAWAAEAGPPERFAYREPLLFVAYRGGAVEVVRINKSYQSAVAQPVLRVRMGGRSEASAESAGAQLVGDSGEHGCFVLRPVRGAGGGRVGTELVCVNGIRALRQRLMASTSTETLLSSVFGGGAAADRADVDDGCSTDTLSTIPNAESDDVRFMY